MDSKTIPSVPQDTWSRSRGATLALPAAGTTPFGSRFFFPLLLKALFTPLYAFEKMFFTLRPYVFRWSCSYTVPLVEH